MVTNPNSNELYFIKDLYFKWICSFVFPDEQVRSRYLGVLSVLHSIPFQYTIELDRNRLMDGIDLRYHFSCSCHIPYDLVSTYFDKEQCSFLEMMAALAKRCEDDLMADLRYGDRSYQWFWIMFCNLGLDGYSDDMYGIDCIRDYVTGIIYKCMFRQYESDGSHGGLFVYNPTRYAPALTLYDFRKMQLWDQMMTCMNHIYYK